MAKGMIEAGGEEREVGRGGKSGRRVRANSRIESEDQEESMVRQSKEKYAVSKNK